MRRLIASFLLFAYLLANTELRELAKVNAFVSHFAEHKAEDKNLTLLGFIKIHYFSGIVIDDDYDKDMKLPFKTTDYSNSIPTHTIPQPVFFTFHPVVSTQSNSILLYDQTTLPSSHVAEIWQPPKAC